MMKITFYSNFLNHHQLPLCLNLIQFKNVDFHFVAGQAMSSERRILGYQDMNTLYSVCIPSYLSEENMEVAKTLIMESDIVIWGDAPENLFKERILANKLTFRFTERIFKKWFFRFMPGFYKMYRRYQNYNFYILCAGGYVAQDFHAIGNFQNKLFKWGYFPKMIEYNLDDLFSKKLNQPQIRILWCGRFLNWKHPELAIEAAIKLKENYANFHLTMVGEGIEKKKIEQDIQTNGLIAEVECLSAQSPEGIRIMMETSQIFLMTSDAYEGWGAVVNEAMNSGCAVLGDVRVGSIPYLIQDQVNGLIYKNKKELIEKLVFLVNNQQVCEQLGREAYKTITTQWNAQVAANNFVELCQNLLVCEKVKIEEGPCSPVE